MLELYNEKLNIATQLRSKFKQATNRRTRTLKEQKTIESDLNNLQKEKDRYFSDECKREYDQIKSSYSPLLQELESVKDEIKIVEDSINPALKNIDMEEFTSEYAEYIQLLSDLEPTVRYLVSNIPSIEIDTTLTLKESIPSLSKLSTLIDNDDIAKPIKRDVLDYIKYDNPDGEDKGLTKAKDMLINILTVPTQMNIPKHYQALMYGGYAVCVGMLFVNFAFGLVLLGGLSASYIYSENQKKKHFDTVYTRLSNFLSMYDATNESIKERQETFIEEKKEEVKQNILRKIKSLQKEYTDLANEYKNAIDNIVVDNDEVRQRVERDFLAKEARLNEATKTIVTKLSSQQSEIDKIKSEISKVCEEISEIKENIIDTYMSLNKIGSSQLMIQDFLLGFNDQTIMFIKHRNRTMNIFFTGTDSEKNSVLINMMIAQCFGNMSPNSLRITIVDTDFTCRDYAIYNNERLNPIFDFISIDSDFTNELKKIHTEMLKRSSIVSKAADDIDAYNRDKIAKDSLTLDYHLVFLQNAKMSLLKNPLFIQICRTGPRFGIFPIVFMSKQIFDNIVSGECQKEEQQDFKEYIKIVENTCWSFNQETYDLEETDLHAIRR